MIEQKDTNNQFVKLDISIEMKEKLVKQQKNAYMLKKSIQKKQYYYTWILMIIMIFCITEPRLFDITFNPFIVLTLAGQKSIVDKDVKRGKGDAREYAEK